MIFVLIESRKSSTTSWGQQDLLDRTRVEIVLESQWDEDEDEVEDEHGESHAFGHFPVEDENGQKDKNQHAE